MSQKTLQIPVLDWEDLTEGFLKAKPKPEDEEVSDEEWVLSFLRDQLLTTYKNGKVAIAAELAVPVINENIIGA